MPSVLLKMKLATLPGHAREASLTGLLQPGMIVTDDQFDAMQPALTEAVQELAPVYFRFRKRHAAAMANLLVTRIENNVRNAAQGS